MPVINGLYHFFLMGILTLLLCQAQLLAMSPNAGDAVLLDIPKSEPEEPTKKEKFIKWLHNRHTPKNVGLNDPYLPSFVKYRPTLVPLPLGAKLPKEFVVRDNSLDLRSLTPQALSKLSSKSFKTLLDYLCNIETEIKWSDKDGHTQSGKTRKHRAHHLSSWDKSNAAAALALSMGTAAQSDLFVTMIALAPEAILPEFRGHVPGLTDASLTARIIATMLMRLEKGGPGDSEHIAKLISLLTEQGLSYWVGKNIIYLSSYLAVLLSETTALVNINNVESPEQVLGVLMGSILSGTMKHVEAIKRTDEKRIWLVGVISNLVWAATAFIACAPLAGPVAAATAGGISVGAVLSATIYNALEFPRDYKPSLKIMEGKLEIAALESARLKEINEKINVLMMLKWMQASIHVNGCSD